MGIPTMSMTILAELPDDVFLNILNKLPMEDAVATSVLSWRWSNLWKSLSVIDLNDRLVEERAKKVVGLVNNFIKLHEQDKIKCFSVFLKYDSKKRESYTRWVDFAVKMQVEELFLDFSHRENMWKRGPDPHMRLPDNIFNCSSMVRLKLTFARLNLLPPLCLTSLKELHLNNTQLSDDAVEIITANCPLIDCLLLSDCNRNRNLKITIATNSNLSKLMIKEYTQFGGHTEIAVASRITTFEFLSGMERRIYSIENVPAVIEARLSFDEDLSSFLSCTFYGDHIETKLDRLLENFQAVKVLYMCSICVQYLTIRELRNQGTLLFDLTRLVFLKQDSQNMNSLGLRSCSELVLYLSICL